MGTWYPFFRGFFVPSTTGNQRAVDEIGRRRLAGFTASLIGSGFYMARLPTLPRQLRIGFEWLWTCLFPGLSRG